MNDRYLYKAKTKLIVGTYNKGKEDGKWVKGYLYNDVGRWMIKQFDIDKADYVDYEVDPSTICQCTGLKDKNGKLIWENDILCGHLDEDLPEDTTYEKVVWRNSGFCTHQEDSCDYEPLDDFITQNFEACGNIFDNPELTEVGE